MSDNTDIDTNVIQRAYKWVAFAYACLAVANWLVAYSYHRISFAVVFFCIFAAIWTYRMCYFSSLAWSTLRKTKETK